MAASCVSSVVGVSLGLKRMIRLALTAIEGFGGLI
jgi:hypothetical protein